MADTDLLRTAAASLHDFDSFGRAVAARAVQQAADVAREGGSSDRIESTTKLTVRVVAEGDPTERSKVTVWVCDEDDNCVCAYGC